MYTEQARTNEQTEKKIVSLLTRHRERASLEQQSNKTTNMTDTSNDISVKSLNELKSTGNSNNLQRIFTLQHAFQQQFNIQPKFFVNVPGR